MIDLNKKIERINVLKRLLEQDRVQFKSKSLGDPEVVDALNTEIKTFIESLLNKELNIGQTDVAKTSPERLKLLEEIATKLESRAVKSGTQPPPSKPLPVANPSNPQMGRVSSIIQDAINTQNKAFKTMTQEERIAKMKEAEEMSKLTRASLKNKYKVEEE